MKTPIKSFHTYNAQRFFQTIVTKVERQQSTTKAKMAPTPTWSSKGKDAAQLFRDFYFGKYTKTTAPVVIHEDRDRPYRFYNKNGFYRHIKKVCEQVETYKKFKTGLGDPVFKKLVRLDEDPLPEERGSSLYKKEGEKEKEEEKSKKQLDDYYGDDDDEDSSYSDEDEEDLPSLGSGFDLDSCLVRLSLAASSPTSNKNSKLSAPAFINTMSFKNNVVGEKYLAICPDGRLAAMVKLTSGFNGTISLSLDCRKVIMKTTIPKVMLDANKCFAKIGIPKTNVYVVHMQAVIDSVKDEAIKGPGTSVFKEVDIFHLPCKVRPVFTNHEGIPDHSVQIGTSSGVEWAFFFMEDENVAKHMRSPEARMVRDRTRSRTNSKVEKPGVSAQKKKLRIETSPFFHTPREYEGAITSAGTKIDEDEDEELYTEEELESE